MADATLSQQAKGEVLKRIIEFAPKVSRFDQLADLAEAYALVTGQVSGRRSEVTVSK